MSNANPPASRLINVNESTLRANVLNYLRSPAANAMFEELEIPTWLGWILTLILLPVSLGQILSIYWARTGLTNLKNVLTLEIVRNHCKCEGRKHPEKMIPVVAHGIITGSVAGLVLGSLANQPNHDLLARIAVRLGNIYKDGPSDPKEEPIYRLLKDDMYKAARRRPLAPFIKVASDAILFDVTLAPANGKLSPLQSVMYAFVAEEKEDGDIQQIPWEVVDPAILFTPIATSVSTPSVARG